MFLITPKQPVTNVSFCCLYTLTLSLSLSLRDIMNRSDSDSALPHSHSESRGLYSTKPLLLSSRLQPLQGQGSGAGGGGLEKCSSLGELRGNPGAFLASSCSTRSLCITSDAVDGPLSNRRSPMEEDGGDESESTGSRRRNAFNKIFKKKQGRHWTGKIFWSPTCFYVLPTRDAIFIFIVMNEPNWRSQEMSVFNASLICFFYSSSAFWSFLFVKLRSNSISLKQNVQHRTQRPADMVPSPTTTKQTNKEEQEQHWKRMWKWNFGLRTFSF